MKDWTGGATSIYATHGASNHSAGERADLDYYATPPAAVAALLEREKFGGRIWEPACGGGHISQVLRHRGHLVFSTDIVDRGYLFHNDTLDFLKETYKNRHDIITNPPYKYAAEFAEHALDISVRA